MGLPHSGLKARRRRKSRARRGPRPDSCGEADPGATNRSYGRMTLSNVLAAMTKMAR